MSDKFFIKYNETIRKRIPMLFSQVIDHDVIVGIRDPQTMTEHFLKQIRTKELETWQSLRPYLSSTHFYNECVAYADERIPEYVARYCYTEDAGKPTDGQLNFLSGLISNALRHRNEGVREKGLEEMKEILKLLSKSGNSHYIDRFISLLGYLKCSCGYLYKKDYEGLSSVICPKCDCEIIVGSNLIDAQ